MIKVSSPIVYYDISRVCESVNLWSLWSTTDTGGHSLPTVIPLEICDR